MCESPRHENGKKKERKKTHSAKVHRGQSLSAHKQALAGITATEAARPIREDTRGSPPGGHHQGVTARGSQPVSVWAGLSRLEESEHAHTRPKPSYPFPSLHCADSDVTARTAIACPSMNLVQRPVLGSEIIDVVLITKPDVKFCGSLQLL